MSTQVRRRSSGLLPAFADFPDLFPEFFDRVESPLALLRGFTGQLIRVEDYVEGDDYIVRAELPGVDPDKDIEITVSDDALHIRAERQEEYREGRRSEFRYGSFSRTLPLPKGVNADSVKASYDKGVLTVTVPLPKEPKAEAKRVAIKKK
ncbi:MULTISPECIES: Hsp20/alpha crystallin family protein [Thermomonospora]|uniref:Heat shock protein Hsp20 n=1 Tax=Thermomonospora curvata (strain ATCC 19995 / DSM 43183 / JCM 3096 / KCTC 9072 / NBRC 15933 / NCIMB 10081 / Henssen B9) TaxID=471852 RepID=D1A6V0_THECD|nr:MULTISPECIES: Hsp20/alpha crystallin family protein [Thermomonospora]ACY98354.1 heat shock protein Hsp20 [Thermomonospora curvata DSM 43183]PKK13516.1 MAG: Hsp20/alpha crystallin family protein [Thermomonospora sp. CIF 1]